MSYNTISNDNLETLLKERQDKERIFDRVSSLMQLNESVYLVLGNKFKYSISQWQKPKDKVYYCLDNDKRKGITGSKQITSFQKSMSIYNISNNMQWWDDAIWEGVAFIFDKHMQEIPILALLFRNVSEGKKIVNEWKERIIAGKPSVEVQFIKGINKEHPTWYRVCLVPEIPEADLKEGGRSVVVCRMRTMPTQNTNSLDALEKYLPRFGRCRLIAISIDNNNQIQIPNSFEDSIEVKKVTITDAWCVSVHDSTRNALEWDDDPVIPDKEKTTAPVLKILEMLRNVHEKQLKNNS